MSYRTDAQPNRAYVRFLEKEYNFGTFRESDGIISHEFSFINEGNTPVIISDVTSNCGCTIPSWTTEPVLPGDSGKITVNYDPAERPGTFVRPVTVISNTGTSPVTLVVRGVVIPVDLKEEVYRYRSGDILFSSLYAPFGELYKGTAKKQTVRILNSGQDTIEVGHGPLPAHINIRILPGLLAPGEEGVIEIEYITEKTVDWDYVVDRIKIFQNRRETGDDINITANIREDFSGLTSADLLNAPVVSFNTSVFDFGTIKAADNPVSFDFMLTNKGKRDLIIRKISASCGCTAVAPDMTVIKPGTSARITAVFSPSGQSGSQKKAVTVITNDPKRSKSILWIEGIVEDLVSR